jgi:hypothetical protein
MSTWSSLVARVLHTDPIANSALTNAYCEFEEGDLQQKPGTGMIRHINVSFYGDILRSGRSYIMFATMRLSPNNNYIDQPKASPQNLHLLYIFIIADFLTLR